jgi:phospholipid/cholesterol/gamma-HCH transport system substrate-binding protein
VKLKLSNEVKTGIIVISGIVILIWGINFLKGKDFFTRETRLYAVYSRVDGLIPSNNVYLNGLKIGTVRYLDILPDNSGRILVTLHIHNNVSIPKNSTAQIYNTDLLGAKSVRIVLSKETAPVKDGDTLVASIQSSFAEDINTQVAPIKEKAEILLSSMDSVLVIFQAVFNEGTRENLKKSFESISRSLRSLEGISSNLDTLFDAQQNNIGAIIKNLRSITENINKNNDKISAAINNFSAISDTLAKANLATTLASVKKSLEQTTGILTKINRGEGSLGLLANNDSLYHNLNNASLSLDALLRDLRANPKRYINFSIIDFGGSGKTKTTEPKK